MENVILVVHLILALSLIGIVLLQRSEGGGLGIGGGGLGPPIFSSSAALFSALCFRRSGLGVCFVESCDEGPDEAAPAAGSVFCACGEPTCDEEGLRGGVARGPERWSECAMFTLCS